VLVGGYFEAYSGMAIYLGWSESKYVNRPMPASGYQTEQDARVRASKKPPPASYPAGFGLDLPS
jgi:hypothetical protein